MRTPVVSISRANGLPGGSSVPVPFPSFPVLQFAPNSGSERKVMNSHEIISFDGLDTILSEDSRSMFSNFSIPDFDFSSDSLSSPSTSSPKVVQKSPENTEQKMSPLSSSSNSISTISNPNIRPREHEYLPDDRAEKQVKRARVACVLCKKAKQRCDNNRPCSRCIGKGREDECKEEQHVAAAVSSVITLNEESEQVDFTSALTRFIQDYKPQEIHDMIIESPLTWIAFLGMISRWTNPHTCLQLRCKLLSEALCVATKASLPVLMEVNPLKENRFNEVQFLHVPQFDQSQDIIPPQETENICRVFNVRALERSDVAIVRVAFFPHKDGFDKTIVRYYWNDAMTRLLESDYKSFYETSHEKWHQLKGDSGLIPPAFWNMFTADSYERILKFLLDVFVQKKALERIEQLDVRTLHTKRVIKCCVRWQTTLFPRVQIPSSITIAIRALSMSYNPFAIDSQKTFS
jgi:hypothetical protein